MTTGKQLWPGETMRAFFRAHVRRETSLRGEEAEKLVEALTRAVNRMLVWDAPRVADAPSDATAAVTTPASGHNSRPASSTDAARGGRSAREAASPADGKPEKPAFNPYAFSAMVVLAKAGREGLMRRLSEIKSGENLRALAEAQHLAIAPNIKKLDDLRREIVIATERRLADRKAAAS